MSKTVKFGRKIVITRHKEMVKSFLISKGLRVLLRSPISKKIVIKYNLEDYFGIDIQMKVIDLEIFNSIYIVRFTNAIMNSIFTI
jgi:hypothetical protein